MFLPRSYSHHSLLSAIPQIPKLVKDAKQKGYTTLALTDEDSGSGLIEFYNECLKEKINPVLGCSLNILNLVNNSHGENSGGSFSKIAILAKNQQGYQSLLRFITKARVVRENPVYHLTLQDLKEEVENYGNNFKVLILEKNHEFGQCFFSKKEEKARKILNKYLKVLTCDNILVEVFYPGSEDDNVEIQQANLKLVDFLNTFKVKALISPAPRYSSKEEEEAYKVVLAIKNQVKLSEINLDRDFNLPDKNELQEKFSYLKQIQDTSELEKEFNIKIITDYDKHGDDAFFPKFPLEKGQNPAQRLCWESYIGFLIRFHPEVRSKSQWQEIYPYQKLSELVEQAKKIKPDEQRLQIYPENYWEKHSILKYIERLDYELDIINKKGYSEYFLVYGDIMSFCKDHQIVTNTRGSAASSLVGYLININVLDPIMYDLPFERFLNPDRPSPPDIDGDFADDKRDMVIDYIRSKYGQDKVAQIITFGTMLPKAAVRDVGRVLGISYKKCDRLSKLIPTPPQGRKATFDFAFAVSSEVVEVYNKDEECRRIIDIAKKIEGNYRHASSHAAGLLITPTELTNYTPCQWDSEHKTMVSQYDMKICEKVGLVKLDILGITNLAILGNAISLAQARRNLHIDLLNINLEDKSAFELLSKGRTMGTFQLSGATMTRYLVELEPTRVEDLMAMVALYRPGPMANIPEYIKRKKNPKLIKYYVPQMKEWMEPNFGILVYQEDVIMTAINLAGYTWGEVDVLRKGMGKKIQSVIETQHPKFVEGCMKVGGLTKKKAEEIWQAFLPFGAYGFNKSHSASYGMVAYWTAYMKAHYTVEFMTAYMTSEGNNLDKVAQAIVECREMGISVLPPDVNKSMDTFSIEDNHTIRYGLTSVKNLGSDVISEIIREREKGGLFKNIEDFLFRLGANRVLNKRSIEALILSGCLDDLGRIALQDSKILPL